MADLARFDEDAWGRFLAFVLDEGDAVSPAEVQAAVQRLGMDLRPAVARVQAAMRSAAARAALERARSLRPSLVQKILEHTCRGGDSPRDQLRAWIDAGVAAPQRAVFYRRLEYASTEEDLRSLLEDLQRLDLLASLSREPDEPSE
ncbi:MAG: hypothetical protein EYC70_08485 [Planctomycetota bacterium]|nr:MAG: hypothetical protein EYC70_08485 [Planctomycetota bacterium]